LNEHWGGITRTVKHQQRGQHRTVWNEGTEAEAVVGQIPKSTGSKSKPLR